MTMLIGDCETNGLIEQATKFHCLCFSPSTSNKFYIFCDLEELSNYDQEQFKTDNVDPIFFPTDDYVKLLNSPKTTGICVHNIYGYDLKVWKKLSGIDYDWKSINERELELVDSLVWSQYLYPDRPIPQGCKGAHGLQAWGVRLGIAKPIIEDWSDQPLDVYINRVIEDVRINKAVYFALQKEIQDVAIDNGTKKGQWVLPLKMANKTRYLMELQTDTGVCFDIQGAKDLVERIDKEMKEIEDEIEPRLGERVLPKSQQPNFPSNPFKKAFDYSKPFTKKGGLKKPVKEYLNKIGIQEDKMEEYIKGMFIKQNTDGCVISENKIEELLPKHPDLLSAAAITYCEKFDIIDKKQQLSEIEMINDLIKKGFYDNYPPKEITEKLKLQHKKDVKIFLIKELNWKPTLWKARNILIDSSTKKKLPKEKTEQKLDAYIKEFRDSVYWPFILKELGYSEKSKVDPDSKSFREKCLKNGRNLIAAPQYTDQRGKLCPNLKKIDEDTAKKICKWLSLQNRRNTILSENETGWLANPRLQDDGRLPAGASGITNTMRMKHSIVVNVAKPKDHVVLGKEMRGLFIPRENYYLVGGDGSSLEARIMAHYTWPFDGGEYAKAILEGDWHTTMAKAYSDAAGFEINRDDGKNASYAIIYSVQAQKLSKMLSVSPEVAQKIIDAFYEVNYGLAKSKEAVIKYWEATGKKYIQTIDGSKIWVRSQHSAQNALFQSTGSRIMDWAGCWTHDMIVKERLNYFRVLYQHDEYQGEHHKDEIEIKWYDEEPGQYRDGKQYSKAKEIDGKYVQCYSRAGELVVKGIEEAGKYFNMNLPMPGEYLVSKLGWRGTH